MKKPRILIACGYFDWFSGYQEVGLAQSLARIADVTVLAGNRVNPGFTDAHLSKINVDRVYETGTKVQNDVTVVRVQTKELRSMLWNKSVARTAHALEPDAVVQIMPGQLLPALATPGISDLPRAVVYGDNSAMWTSLKPWAQAVKWMIFSQTKGRLYKYVNKRAQVLYGYTPETLDRLKKFGHDQSMNILPLAFRTDTFYFDSDLRASTRRSLGLQENEIAVLVAGKVQKQKRIDLVAEAIGEARYHNRLVKLVVAGDDQSAETTKIIREAIQSAQLDDASVVRTGFLSAEQLNAVFNACDLGVWPAMPAITIQQAMGTGLYVCLPDNAYVSHLLRPGSGAYVYPSESMSAQIFEHIPEHQEASNLRRNRAMANHWLSSDALAINVLKDLGQ